MTPTLRQFLLSLVVAALFILLAAYMSAHARNMMGPGAYYDQQLDVILRGDPGSQQIYDPHKDVWYNVDVNLQRNKSLQQFQLHFLPQSEEQSILSQLSEEQQSWGDGQPGLQDEGQQRRDAEAYERNFRARHGMDPLPDNTMVPAPGMPLDPYARRNDRQNTACTDPHTGEVYICPQP